LKEFVSPTGRRYFVKNVVARTKQSNFNAENNLSDQYIWKPGSV